MSSSLSDFYTISNWQADGENISCTVAFNSSHSIFDGHFPGQPVVPGVCSMAIVKEICSRMIGQPLMISSTGQVKFLRLLTPVLVPSVQLTCKHSDNGWLVQSDWKVDGADAFKMTAVLERGLSQFSN